MENFNISERPYYFEVEIINKYGLHARPAKILATEMKKYPQYNIRV
jgi:phosphotransferase system HPr-like phosphotransfer protein